MSDFQKAIEKFQTKLAERQQWLREHYPDAVSSPEPETAHTPACATCGDVGVVKYNVPVDHPLFGKMQPCPVRNCVAGQQHRQRQLDNRVKHSGLPPVYARFTFETWAKLPQQQRAGKELPLAACQLFVERANHYFSIAEAAALIGSEMPDHDRRKNSIMLHGPVGMGKTGLIACCVNALLDAHEPVLYVRARDLIANVQERYRTQEKPTPDEMIATFKSAPVLVIDEFNLANNTEDRREIVETVMRHRHAHSLPTLMTANVNQADFARDWSERTADVVIHTAHWIHVRGGKLRATEGSVG